MKNKIKIPKGWRVVRAGGRIIEGDHWINRYNADPTLAYCAIGERRVVKQNGTVSGYSLTCVFIRRIAKRRGK